MASTYSKIIKNVASNWVGLVVQIAVSFFISPFVVNHLGAEIYGIWAVAMQFTGYIYLMDFGVRDSLIRYTAKYRATGNDFALRRILSVALMIYVPVFLAAMVVTSLITYAFPSWVHIDEAHTFAAQLTIFCVGTSISLTFLFNIYTGLLQGLQRFDVSNAMGVVITLVRAGVIVITLNQGGGIVELATIQLAFTVVSGFGSYFAAKVLMADAGLSIRPIRVFGRKLRALIRLVAGYSVYVFINNIGQRMALVTDALVISLFMPIASVTYYAIAGSLISYLSNLVSATSQVFKPVASQFAAHNDKEGLRILLLRSTRLTLTIALPVICAYAILGDIFIGVWMGEEFVSQASKVLLILALTQVLGCPHYSIAGILYGIGRHRTLAFLRIGEGVTNLVLSIFLVQSIGIVGVALGTAIPHIVIFGIILPLYACRLLGLSWWQYVSRSLAWPLLNAVPFSVGAWVIHEYMPPSNLLTFFLAMGLLSLVYIATGFRLCLHQEERDMVRDRLGRFLRRRIPMS